MSHQPQKGVHCVSACHEMNFYVLIVKDYINKRTFRSSSFLEEKNIQEPNTRQGTWLELSDSLEHERDTFQCESWQNIFWC